MLNRSFHSIIAACDSEVNKKRVDSDHDNFDCEVVENNHSATYMLENKVPVQPGPVLKGNLISADQVKDKFPHIDNSDNEDETFEDDFSDEEGNKVSRSCSI
jgi:hypothetical protein